MYHAVFTIDSCCFAWCKPDQKEYEWSPTGYERVRNVIDPQGFCKVFAGTAFGQDHAKANQLRVPLWSLLCAAQFLLKVPVVLPVASRIKRSTNRARQNTNKYEMESIPEVVFEVQHVAELVCLAWPRSCVPRPLSKARASACPSSSSNGRLSF